MPRQVQRNTDLSEKRLREIFAEIKPVYRVDEAWLQTQRVKLKGAIAVTAEAGLLVRFWERLQLWWEELPYLWAPARPALAWAAALVVGILIGRFLLLGPSAPGLSLADEDVSRFTHQQLAELIRTGQLEDIDVNLSDDPQNPVELNLVTGREMTLTGTAEREDILAALEYVLVKDPNPGQRLQSARILGGTSQLESKKSTLMALVSALLSDENAGVRLSIIGSLQGIQSPLIKDALIKVVMEDENEGVRLAAVKNLANFLDDLSVRSALLLVSRMDPMESVRYQAYQTLSQVTESLEEERLDLQP
ncbi:MAG: HEAT repeat domain-containing protein [Candidatus Neomarinimicrobiota bacterium]